MGNRKGSYLSNVLTMEKLENFPPNIPIQIWKRVMMKKLKIIKNIKR